MSKLKSYKEQLQTKKITDNRKLICQYQLAENPQEPGEAIIFIKIENCYPGKSVGEMEDLMIELIQETTSAPITFAAYLNI